MRYVVHDAPAGAEPFWRPDEDVLHIWVSADLDEVSRQRYITQATREHGIEPTRRRGALPFFIAAGAARSTRNAAREHKNIAAGSGVAIAAGTTAAILLLAANGNGGSITASPGRSAPHAMPQPGHRHPRDQAKPQPRPASGRRNPPPLALSAPRPHGPTSGPPASSPLDPPPVEPPPSEPPTDPPTAPPVSTQRTAPLLRVRVRLPGLLDARLRLRLPATRRPVVPSPHANP